MNFSVRTDLAIEASAMLSKKAGESIDGVTVHNYAKNDVNVRCRVRFTERAQDSLL